MFFQWNAQTFQWFEDASAYTGYNRELAKLLLLHLKDCRTICDIGCGMALVDFELAPFFDEVTCTDINEAAIRYVEQQTKERNLKNLHPVHTDGMQLNGTYDAVMALFHGDVETVGERYLSYAGKKLILQVHASAYGSTGPEKYRIRKCCDIDGTKEWLDQQKLSYSFEMCELEFGQPHRSLEEAVQFTRTFTRKVPDEELIPYVREHVIETGRADFPLYTPKSRSFGLFIIDAEK